MLVIKQLKTDKVLIASSETNIIKKYLNDYMEKVKNNLLSELYFKRDSFTPAKRFEDIEKQLKDKAHLNDKLLALEDLYYYIINTCINHHINCFKEGMFYESELLGLQVTTYDQINLGIV